MEYIAQGAEAKIKKEDKFAIKERITKSYRIPEIDLKLRKQRTKKESKILSKVYGKIPTPKLFESKKDFEIKMEFIEGKKLSEHLDKIKSPESVCEKIGNNIAVLHDMNIIHGDLTTSNMILKKEEVYFIDYGLSFESSKIEDKAVDLHLIKQALESRHYKKFDKYFKYILKGYKKSGNYNELILRLEKVEKRGRYKSQY